MLSLRTSLDPLRTKCYIINAAIILCINEATSSIINCKAEINIWWRSLRNLKTKKTNKTTKCRSFVMMQLESLRAFLKRPKTICFPLWQYTCRNFGIFPFLIAQINFLHLIVVEKTENKTRELNKWKPKEMARGASMMRHKNWIIRLTSNAPTRIYSNRSENRLHSNYISTRV